MKFPSKKTLDEQKQEFTLLPADDYKLKIVEVKEEKQNKYQSEEIEDIVNITLDVISFKDGETAKDIEDEDATGRKIFFTARPESIGFQSDGTPAKTRCLVAYTTGQDIFDELVLDKWEDIVGKEITAEIIQKQNLKGEKKNRIARFLSPRQRTAEKAEAEEIPADDSIEETI